MRAWVPTFVIALAVASPARSDETPAFDLDRLTGQPGIATTQKKDGTKIIKTWSKNGVSIVQTTDGSRTDVFATDATSKGAVMCSWMIDVSIRATLETCPDPQFDVLRSDLDQGITDIDNFIAANSIQPVDIKQLRAREESQYAMARKAPKVAPSHPQNFCKEGDTGLMVAHMNNMTHEQRQKSIVDLLATPRWPVANPCL